MACKYTIGGKEYSEREFKEFLAQRVIDADINSFVKKLGEELGAQEKIAGDILRTFADKIEKGKINKLSGFRASTGFDAVWDGSLTVIAESLRKGAKLADAIESGLKYIRQTDWYKQLVDKDDFESQYKNHFFKEYESLSVEEKPDSVGRGKRMTTQRVLSGTYRKAFKDAMTENAIYYKQLPTDLTLEEAQTIIDIKGIGESEALIFDMNNTLSLPVRFTIAQKLIDGYEKSGETLKAVDIFERIVEKITDTAQGLQSLTNWPKLSKASQVAMAKKNIEIQRNKLKKQSEKTTNKIDKQFRKANKEAAEETVKAVKKIIDANTKLEGEGSITDLPIGYGVKNKVFTRDRYLKAKKMLRGMAMSGATPEYIIDIAGYHIEATGRDFARFARRMKADLGSKIKPFIKDIYGQARESLIKEGYDKSLFLTDEEVDANINEQNGQIWKEKLEKAIEKGDNKAQKIAIKKLQEISKDEGVWGQYKESAAKKLRGMVITNIEKDISGNPSLQQFTDGLVKNMRQKMAELLPEKSTQKSIPRPAIEIIGDAYKNLEKYKEVWEQTQKEFQEKYAEQPEVLQAIDDYFGEILDKPFSDKLIESAVKKGLKDLGTSISDLVVQHYTVLDNAGQTLAQKLVNEAGLTGIEAASLANAIQEEFSRIATKKKEAILERIFSKKERKKPAVKGLESEIVKLTNLGAFRTDEIVEAYADKMGFPKLTEENIKEIERLSDVVEKTTDPIKKRRAVEDLLAYQAKIKGISITELVTAIWYANVLSGYNTQIVNFGANAINTSLLFANAIAQRPKDTRFIAKGLVQGIKRGLLESKETFKTGYSPIKGKAEIPQILEREDFRNYSLFKRGKFEIVGGYINLLKYVRRAMVAADVIFFEGLKEMRAYQSAMMQASKEMKDRPSNEQWDRAIELVGKSDKQLESIKNQAELEYQEAVTEINQSDNTNDQKKKLIEQAARDKGRRIFDLIEQQRSSDIIQETAEYAAQGTYNYQPKGALGAFANSINTMVQSVPAFRIIVPFTNIIANVANETINYTPLAFTRLEKGGWTNFRREQLTERQRADLITKGAIGTTAMAIVFALTQIKGEDDEPLLEITANGAGDFAKNATLQETGWQPYSFRVKLPNGEYTSWISYQYSPLIASLGFIGHVNDLIKYKDVDDEETMYSLMSKAAGLTVNTFFQATFLEGLNDFLSGLFDPRASQSLWDKSVKASIQTAKGVLLPNMISQLSKGMESIFGGYKKETGENLLGIVLEDIPYARNILYDKINILGEPISSDTDKFLSFNKPNKYIQLLIDKKAVFAPINRKAEKIYDIELGKERILTDEEFYDYSRDKGQFIKQALEINYDKFSKMTPNEFRKELKSIKQDATESARYSIADLGTNLIEIEKNVDGVKRVYKLNSEKAKIAKGLVDKRLKSSDMSIIKNGLVDLYVNTKKMTKQKAEREADIKINKMAIKYAQNEIWLKHLQGTDAKYILELK